MALDDRLFKRHIEDDEEVVRVVHKHWLIGVKFLFWPAVAFVAGWIGLYIAPFRLMFYLVAVWSVGSLVYLLRNFFDYYLDAWIITDQGIIDVEWHGWFHRQSTRVLFSDIQGVSYEINGILGTFLRFGTISVEKISTGSVISMEYVKQPRSVEGLVLRNMEGYLHAKNLGDEEHVKEILAGMIAKEAQLEQFEDEEEDEYEDDEN